MEQENQNEEANGVEGKKGKTKKNNKRGQGEGSIYKRKDGRWVGVVNLGYQNGKLNRKYYYGETRKDVSDKLTAALSDLQKNLMPVPERQTVEQFLEQWLSDCVKPAVRPRTFDSYSQLVRLYLSPALGKIKLAKLTPQHVQALMKKLLAKELSPRTVQYTRSVLRRALEQALRWGYVARNVASLVDSPRIQRPDITPMSVEDAKKFLQAMKGDKLEALFSVALAMGLRQGEALGLRWQDIDFDSHIIRVRVNLQRINKKFELVELKTKSSRRDLPMIDRIASALRTHKTRQLQDKLLAGSSWQETGLVFTTRTGAPFHQSNVNGKYQALLIKAGLPHFRFHDLRHSCASLLLVQGVPLKTISDILGHSGIRTTADYYAHIAPEMRRDALDMMNNILASGS